MHHYQINCSLFHSHKKYSYSLIALFLSLIFMTITATANAGCGDFFSRCTAISGAGAGQCPNTGNSYCSLKAKIDGQERGIVHYSKNRDTCANERYNIKHNSTYAKHCWAKHTTTLRHNECKDRQACRNRGTETCNAYGIGFLAKDPNDCAEHKYLLKNCEKYKNVCKKNYCEQWMRNKRGWSDCNICTYSAKKPVSVPGVCSNYTQLLGQKVETCDDYKYRKNDCKTDNCCLTPVHGKRYCEQKLPKECADWRHKNARNVQSCVTDCGTYDVLTNAACATKKQECKSKKANEKKSKAQKSNCSPTEQALGWNKVCNVVYGKKVCRLDKKACDTWAENRKASCHSDKKMSACKSRKTLYRGGPFIKAQTKFTKCLGKWGFRNRCSEWRNNTDNCTSWGKARQLNSDECVAWRKARDKNCRKTRKCTYGATSKWFSKCGFTKRCNSWKKGIQSKYQVCIAKYTGVDGKEYNFTLKTYRTHRDTKVKNLLVTTQECTNFSNYLTSAAKQCKSDRNKKKPDSKVCEMFNGSKVNEGYLQRYGSRCLNDKDLSGRSLSCKKGTQCAAEDFNRGLTDNWKAAYVCNYACVVNGKQMSASYDHENGYDPGNPLLCVTKCAEKKYRCSETGYHQFHPITKLKWAGCWKKDPNDSTLVDSNTCWRAAHYWEHNMGLTECDCSKFDDLFSQLEGHASDCIRAEKKGDHTLAKCNADGYPISNSDHIKQYYDKSVRRSYPLHKKQ